MLDGRVKKIIAFLKEKLTDETESSRSMLKTYSDYLKGDASDEELEKANQQLNEILKDLSLGLMAVIPLAPITIPMIAKFAKKHNIDLLPEWFKDSLK
jgi:Mg2+ and Co2+ transporter CorA